MGFFVQSRYNRNLQEYDMTLTTPRIDQLLAGFAEGDAISGEAIHLQRIFRKVGAASDIFVFQDHVAPDQKAACKSLAEYRGCETDVMIGHYSIDSQMNDTFLTAPGRKIVCYHNITPAEYFVGFDDAVAGQLKRARDRLADVIRRVDGVWTDSAYNASEVERLPGEARVFELPFDPLVLEIVPDPDVLNRYGKRLTSWLFVGRIAPNKCIEELIQTFAWYHQAVNPFSRLIIVGSDRSCPAYFMMLRMLVAELGLPNVCFERFLSPAGLAACYDVADIFITASRHEGYCLPLVEAMFKGIPVVARDVGGMPEALGGAGILFDRLEPRLLAELIHRVLVDDALRSEVMTSQEKRIEAVKQRDIEQELKVLMAPLWSEYGNG